MPGYLLKFDRRSRLLLDAVEFPDGYEYAAEWSCSREALDAPEHVELQVFYCSSFDGLRGTTSYFSSHDATGEPVPLRHARPDELVVNSVEEDREHARRESER